MDTDLSKSGQTPQPQELSLVKSPVSEPRPSCLRRGLGVCVYPYWSSWLLLVGSILYFMASLALLPSFEVPTATSSWGYLLGSCFFFVSAALDLRDAIVASWFTRRPEAKGPTLQRRFRVGRCEAKTEQLVAAFIYFIGSWFFVAGSLLYLVGAELAIVGTESFRGGSALYMTGGFYGISRVCLSPYRRALRIVAEGSENDSASDFGSESDSERDLESQSEAQINLPMYLPYTKWMILTKVLFLGGSPLFLTGGYLAQLHGDKMGEAVTWILGSVLFCLGSVTSLLDVYSRLSTSTSLSLEEPSTPLTSIPQGLASKRTASHAASYAESPRFEQPAAPSVPATSL